MAKGEIRLWAWQGQNNPNTDLINSASECFKGLLPEDRQKILELYCDSCGYEKYECKCEAFITEIVKAFNMLKDDQKQKLLKYLNKDQANA